MQRFGYTERAEREKPHPPGWRFIIETYMFCFMAYIFFIRNRFKRAAGKIF